MRLLAFLFGALTTLAGADILGLLERAEPACVLAAPERDRLPILDLRPVLLGHLPAPSTPVPADDPTAPTPRHAREPIVEVDGEVEEEPEPEVIRRPPSDPIEVGSSSLVLEVRAEETQALLDTQVRLWRLGAPRNEHWTDGDRLHAEVDVIAGVATVDDLPEGTYRAVCKDQRACADDPPAFEVGSRLTRVTLTLPMPRTFRVCLRIVDAHGWPVSRWNLASRGTRSRRQSSGPSWIQRRTLREPDRWFRGGCCGGCISSYGSTSPWDPETDGDVMVWGNHGEDSRGYAKVAFGLVDFAGGNSVEMRARGEVLRDRAYLGVTLPLEIMVAQVRLPCGRPLASVKAQVEAICHAVLVTEAMSQDAWRRVPVCVRVKVLDHEVLEFQATAEDPSPEQTLKTEKPERTPAD